MAVPTPMPMPCGGRLSIGDARELIYDGHGVALVETHVRAPGTKDAADAGWTVRVRDMQVLAGDRTAASAATVSEGGDFLHAGDWILLLGPGVAEGNYGLSDGSRGSFELDAANTTATQQCPGGLDTGGGPVEPVSVEHLAQVFSSAFEAARPQTGDPTR